ncbi:MAG TPA: cyanophycin synthetase [Candidatus Limnocylindrales bacterium]
MTQSNAQPTTPSMPRPELRIVETRVMRGPNYWAREPVIRMVVDLGVLEDFPSNLVPGFTEHLVAAMPSLEEHACSLGRRGGFISRLREGTWMGHISEHIALELQTLAGTEARHGKTRSTGTHGQYNVIYEYAEERVGVEAGKIAVAFVNHLVAPADPSTAGFDYQTELERLIRLAERQAFGPSTQALIDEAVQRDVPWIRLDRYSLIQLGQGVHQQRIRATMTSRTGAIAVDVASDKSLTNALLSAAGLPVPRSEVVDDVDGAVRAAESIGFPCVVKPLDGNHGRGVNLDLRDEADVRKAYPLALAQSRAGDVVVESYVTGNDYRCLVIGGRMAAIAERVPASVTADGEHTVRELVELENRDPRRGIGHEKVLTKISLDGAAEELVRDQGWEFDAVPPAGVWIKLALTGNMSTGGTSIDRTVEAHPENIEVAETAARVVGLDVAGIDFIVPDIAIPVREQGGAIVEVNAAPGFRMHTHPTIGEPQYVAKPVLDLLFPPGTASRIPILAVTGTNGKTTTVRMIAHILKLMGRRVGMTTTDGIVIDGRLIKRGDMSGPKSAQMVLQNPSVDTAVFEVARGGILREGLGYDRNDVAVVTNVTGDHLGLGGINTLRQLADVKAVVVEAVPRSGTAVLNADDPSVARMGRHCHGRIVYFSMATDREAAGWLRVDTHCGRGGAAIVLQETEEGELVVLRHGPRVMPLLHTHLIPATFGGRARMNVANALAAAAAAWAAGAHMHDIRQGLRTFSTSFFQAPGRLNLIEMNGYRVIIDYCHNVDGMRRLTEFVDLLMAGDEPRRGRGRSRNGDGASPRDVEPPKRTGRAFGVIGIPGDRPNGDQREYGALAAASFDRIYVREDRNLRGRKAGESASNVLAGVASARKAGKARTEVAEPVLDEMDAARRALAEARAGDLIVVCADDAAGVYREAMGLNRAPRRATAIVAPGEMAVPEG